MDELQEKIAAGLFKSLLYGIGHDAIPMAERVISHTGAVDTRLPALASHAPGPSASWLDRAKHTTKGVLLGHKPLDVISQRAMTGGLLGKGGIIRGQFGLNPEFHEAISRNGGVLKALMNEPKQIPNAMSDGVNLAFMAGIPAYALGRQALRGDAEGMKETVSENLPWAVASPFGLAGIPISMAGKNVLHRLMTPKIPVPGEMYAQEPEY